MGRPPGRPRGSKNDPARIAANAGSVPVTVLAPPSQTTEDDDDDPDDDNEEEAERKRANVIAPGPTPVDVVKERGALTSAALQKNRQNARILKRKRNGVKHILWDDEGPALYANVVEMFGTDKIKMHITKIQPTNSDHGMHPLSSMPEFEMLRQMIVDQWWDGKKSTFRWLALKNGSHRLAADQISFDDDPVQQKKWAEKQAAVPSQSALQSGQQPLVIQTAGAQQPSISPQHVDFLLKRLGQLEERLDGAAGSVGSARSRPVAEPDQDEEEQEVENDDDQEAANALRRARVRVAASMRSEDPETPMQDRDEYEQVRTPSGTIAWIKKPKVEMPPDGLPEPEPGYAYQRAPSGIWMQVPIHAPAHMAAPVATPVAQHAPTSDAAFSMRDIEMLEEKHRIEVQLAQLQEKYKFMGEIGKVRSEVAAITAAPLAPPQPVATPPTSGLPPSNVHLPPGWAWQQGPAGWQPVQIQAAPVAPVGVASHPESTADQVKNMADTIKNIGNLANVARNIFPKDEAAAAMAGAAAGVAGAAEDDGLPIAPLHAGGWDMWFSKDDKKPVDTATQIALNLGNIQNAAKELIKSGVDGYKEIIEKQQNDKSAKLEKDRLEMAAVIRQQKVRMDEMEQRMFASRRPMRHVNYEDETNEIQDGPIAGSPDPAPDPIAPEQTIPAPPPTTSLSSAAMAAFGRKN